MIAFLICVAAVFVGRHALEHGDYRTYVVCGGICLASGMYMCRNWIKG